MRKLLSQIREKYNLHQTRKTLEQISNEYKIPGTDIYHTPDAPAVDAKDFHLVLVYDEMMQGKSEHFKIEYLIHGPPAGQGITEENVEAWINRTNNKVLAFNAFNKPSKPVWMDQTGANPSPIKGELFKVTARGIFILDKMLENTVQYQRFEVNTVSWLRKNYFSHIHNRTHTTDENPKHRKAWIYLAHPSKWGDLSRYNGWEPLTIWPPRKREKGDGIYFHSYRSKPLVA
jgi:hypothetical protein